MSVDQDSSIRDQVAFYQYSADALCDVRSASAPILFAHIVSSPDYHSSALTSWLGALHVTDKIDGLLAQKRRTLLAAVPEHQLPELLDGDLMTAISEGGRKDDLADKRLTHAIFGSLAVREILNSNRAYGSIIGVCDAVMFARDAYVGKKRDQAKSNGTNADARKLGKYKQLLLVASSVIAVSPSAAPTRGQEKWTVGRTIVAAGMVGGAIMSVISGIDQVKSLREQSSN